MEAQREVREAWWRLEEEEPKAEAERPGAAPQAAQGGREALTVETKASEERGQSEPSEFAQGLTQMPKGQQAAPWVREEEEVQRVREVWALPQVEQGEEQGERQAWEQQPQVQEEEEEEPQVREAWEPTAEAVGQPQPDAAQGPAEPPQQAAWPNFQPEVLF